MADDQKGLALFDADKLSSWRYDKVGTKENPQSFTAPRHNPTLVTGKQKKVGNLVDKITENPSEYANVSYTSVLDKIKDGEPQLFSTENPAGTYSITGLRGDIPGSFFTFDMIKDKSLLMSIWTNSFEFEQGTVTINDTSIPLSVKANNVYTPPRVTNPTHGFNELPTAYRFSGYSAFDDEPRRFGTDVGPNWTVNTLHGTDWGGSQAGDIGDAYLDLTMKSPWWGSFVDKQSTLQSAYTIMKGYGQKVFGQDVDAPFNQVDFIGMSAGFYIGTRGVRIGNIAGGASYLEHAPLLGEIPGNNNAFEKWNEIGGPATPIERMANDVQAQAQEVFSGNPDFSRIPKLGYLYENYVVRDQFETKTDGGIGDLFTGMIVNFVSNAVNPYPIAPSLNVVKSAEKASNFFDEGDLSKRYSTHGLREIPNNSTEKDQRNLYETRLRSPYEDKLFAADGVIDSLAGVEFDPGGGDNQYTPMTGDDLKGTRYEGKQKVYAIGRSGFRQEGNSGALDKEGDLKGIIKFSGDGKYASEGADKVNMIPYGSDEFDGKNYEDLDFIPLSFKDVFNDKYIVFRAMQLGDITDTITPAWEEQEFVGRPVGGATYKGVGRTIGFDFSIVPKTKQEFPILLEKLNYLVGMCYPHLDKFYRQTGPMIKLTVGDIVNDQLGYLTTLTVTFPQDSPWELDPGLRFTHKIDVSLEFTYIGKNIPVATGKHYNLDWLNGEKYDETGVKFDPEKGYPARTKYNNLFKELGQE